jgi:hypothetical protein
LKIQSVFPVDSTSHWCFCCWNYMGNNVDSTSFYSVGCLFLVPVKMCGKHGCVLVSIPATVPSESLHTPCTVVTFCCVIFQSIKRLIQPTPQFQSEIKKI